MRLYTFEGLAEWEIYIHLVIGVGVFVPQIIKMRNGWNVRGSAVLCVCVCVCVCVLGKVF